MKKNNGKCRIKVVERFKVSKARYGKIDFVNSDLESHEKGTVYCLSYYGFDVETIIPSNIPGTRNPDVLMLGTYWEMKAPSSVDEGTIITHFRKAVKQANGKAIFDLRNIKGDAEATKKFLMELFKTTRGMRRLMIIEKSGEKILDIFK